MLYRALVLLKLFNLLLKVSNVVGYYVLERALVLLKQLNLLWKLFIAVGYYVL